MQPVQSYFDYITGTSIGGLEAAALSVTDNNGHFKYNATYLCDHLANRGPKIFSDDKWFAAGGFFRAKYHREPLNKILKELLGDARLSETKMPISMHALKLSTREPMTWSTYVAKSDPSMDYKLVDVAEATSAAPTYFEPKIIDGGLFANDPLSPGLATFIRFNPDFDRHSAFVLSVGTGQREMPSMQDQKALKGTELFNIIDVIFDATQNSQQLSSFKVLEHYYKMDPVLRDDIFKLDVTDSKVINEYKVVADQYADSFISSNTKFMDSFFNVTRANIELVANGEESIVESGATEQHEDL